MSTLKDYLKYYSLENYLFDEVSNNFNKNHTLSDKEFFAIVIWKRNASKTKVKDSLIINDKDIENITRDIFEKENDPKKQLSILTGKTGIGQIGVSIASAILTVCYPSKFTVVDYRAFNSLIKLLNEEENKEEFSYVKDKLSALVKYIVKYQKRRAKTGREDTNDITEDVYFEYLEVCKVLAKKFNLPLRDFDRILWGMDFYDGDNGLKKLVEKYNRKELETKKESVDNSVGKSPKRI